MATPTKTRTEVLAHQHLQHGQTATHAIGTTINVSTMFSASITMFLANVEVTVNAIPPSFLIQLNPDSTGDANWVTVATFTSGIIIAAETEDITSQSTNDITTTGVGAQDFPNDKPIYLRDTDDATPVTASGNLAGAELNSEWHYVMDTPDTSSIFLIDTPVSSTWDTDDEVWEAEIFRIDMNLENAMRLRVVVNHASATGSDIHFKAEMESFDSV